MFAASLGYAQLKSPKFAIRVCPAKLVTILDLLRLVLRLTAFCCSRLRCYSRLNRMPFAKIVLLKHRH